MSSTESGQNSSSDYLIERGTLENSNIPQGHNTNTSLKKITTPHLLNPFLDSIFNSSNPRKEPIKSILTTLSRSHNDFAILVPPTAILRTHYDPSSEYSSTKTRLHESCYFDDAFLRSHIVRTSQPYSSKSAFSKQQSVIYNTLNGKQVLIKNGIVFPGKGFGKSLSLKILKLDYFYSQASYFPLGSRFMLIYVDNSVIGSFIPEVERINIWNWNLQSQSIPTDSQSKTEMNPKESLEIPKRNTADSITFENLLRSFPLLSKAVSDKFYRLFHHNNYQFQILRVNNIKELSQIEKEFNQILEDSFKIISKSVDEDTPNSEATFDLINNILKSYPGLDFNKIIHEYVELNLYDKIWSHLIFQFNDSRKVLTSEIYEELSHLSLNQLDISVEKPWYVNELYKRVSHSIKEFKKLDDTAVVNSQGKTKILVKSIQILSHTSGDGLLVDADTLIGLLIMVIIHSKIDSLEAHIYYIKHFNSINVHDDGYLSYILSNVDAVLLHLSSINDNNKQLQTFSTSNEVFWNYIRKGNYTEIEKLLTEIEGNVLPNNHFLKSRNIDGESCLMMAIKSKNFLIYKLLIDFNLCWFSIDDILFDVNTTTNQSLLMVSIVEECPEIAQDLIEIIAGSCTKEEIIAYYNLPDNLGRTVGHYLHHSIDLVEIVGPYLDWELKDLNSHTPLFSLCRCYDHVNYSDLVERAFSCINNKYGIGPKHLINLNKHIDKNGNTLLHVIQRQIASTGILSNSNNIIDINQFNNKNLTPLALYVKYNRYENLVQLLKDSRIEFTKEDQLHFLNVFDYSSGLFRSLSGKNVAPSIDIEKLLVDYIIDEKYGESAPHKLVVLTGKYDPTHKDWIIFFRERIESEPVSPEDINYTSFHESIEYIAQNMYLMKLRFPLSVIPSKDSFFQNFPAGQIVFPSFNKFRVNRIVEDLNIMFLCLNYHPKYKQETNIWEMFSKAGAQKSTLELIKDIKTDADDMKAKIGEVKLDMLKIQEIEFFLNFSMNDLLKFQLIIDKFNRAISLMDWKTSDCRILSDILLHSALLNSNNEAIDHTTLHDSGSDSAYGELLKYTSTLDIFVTELNANVKRCIDKIDSWKQLHGQIHEYNSELRKYENITGERGLNERPHTNEDSSISSFFNFSSLIESKHTRYKKLVLQNSEEIKKIMSLNVQLKMEHETLAAEISSFLKYKSDFLALSLKIFTKRSIRIAFQRQSELQKSLYQIETLGKW
ncbi:hypothetical protein CAAN1_07S02564 [[Candida] anglica]|uniref:VPS9 domain-containing protein n=1 Tax=[Candida] anglica TaxID=148631 RepID=A0ABP0EDW1_9ASCO